ncbi:MAG: hypothetical protein AB7N71_06010 [Phycisphaerae bacterium]
MGTLHALFILLCPAITAIALLFRGAHGEVAWTSKVASLPIWGGIIVGLVGLALMSCLCPEGNGEIVQWAVPMCCLFAVSLVRDKKIRTPVAALLIVAGFALPRQFENLAHGYWYTSAPRFQGAHRVYLRSELKALQQEEIAQEDSEALLPAGWIEDVLPKREWHKIIFEATRKESHAEWHSWFTRLRRSEHIPIGIWYPGGPWADGITGLEIRDRQ